MRHFILCACLITSFLVSGCNSKRVGEKLRNPSTERSRPKDAEVPAKPDIPVYKDPYTYQKPPF